MPAEDEIRSEIKCAHPLCYCPAPATSDYCSQFCADAADDMGEGERCHCDHPECVVEEPEPVP